MKKVYFTVDIEPIVSKRSFNPTILTNVMLGSIYIAQELQARNQKATFFVSLSPKTPGLSFTEYTSYIRTLLTSLKPFKNIRLEPHLHVQGIPMPFNTDNDFFSGYNNEQATQLLQWAKKEFEQLGIETAAFRPGGFKLSGGYYDALKTAGYKYSSILNPQKPDISFVTGHFEPAKVEQQSNGITEYPVTGIEVKSIKGTREVINLSPDFFTIDSVKDYLHKMDYININFHSFSVFSNRFARENHNGQLWNNIKYLLLEKPANSLCKKAGIELINKNTLFRKEFIRWIDFLEENKFTTYFIGE